MVFSKLHHVVNERMVHVCVREYKPWSYCGYNDIKDLKTCSLEKNGFNGVKYILGQVYVYTHITSDNLLV